MTSSRRAPRIGCSGWNYKSWKGRFYPRDLPATDWLRYYTGVFDTVEVNNTFYRLPEADTFAQWRVQTPKSFVMAVKASRFLTHMKRLRDPEEPIDRLFSRASALGPKLGPVLYQLPGNFTIDLERLDSFLAALPRSPRRGSGGKQQAWTRHAMEFRHPSWYVSETYAVLDKRRVALCLHDKFGSEIAEPFVGPFVYVRFHGTSGRYAGSYPARRLDRWAARLVEQWQSGKEVFAYFNNDPDAVATRNARTLRARIESRCCSST
jgi:uncharacterized protein YecE (DUF72 family)